MSPPPSPHPSTNSSHQAPCLACQQCLRPLVRAAACCLVALAAAMPCAPWCASCCLTAPLLRLGVRLCRLTCCRAVWCGCGCVWVGACVCACMRARTRVRSLMAAPVTRSSCAAQRPRCGQRYVFAGCLLQQHHPDSTVIPSPCSYVCLRAPSLAHQRPRDPLRWRVVRGAKGLFFTGVARQGLLTA